MKKTFAILLTILMLLTTGSALAQTRMLPLYECYPASGDGNAWFELPNQYELYTMPMSYTCGYVVDPSAKVIETSMCVFAHIPEGYVQRVGEMDVSGFAEDGAKVLSGADETEASTVIERYTISDLPAVRVDMTDQGYEMIWIADGGDMYFFMYPILNETFAQDMRDAADTFHLVEAKTTAASDLADYEYAADEAGVTITKYVGEQVRVAIPAEIDGQPVVALADEAFYETGVRWVDVPDSVQTIGEYCFSGCSFLQTLNLPEGLTALPDGMLESCFRLLELTIPDSVMTIGESVFWGNFYLSELRLPASLEKLGGYNFVMAECLERFIVPEGNKAVKTLDDGTVLLSADGTRFIRYCGWQERGSYTIPEGVESIAAFAFADWGQLQEIVVPEGVTTIEGSAFISLRGLQRLTLPASATELGGTGITGDSGLSIQPLDGEKAADDTQGVASIAGNVTIIAPEGSAAQAHAEQFKLTFQAADAADEGLQE